MSVALLQVNDTGMKLFSETREEDIQRIADLTLKRLKEKYPSSLENINPQSRTPSEALLSGTVSFRFMGCADH